MSRALVFAGVAVGAGVFLAYAHRTIGADAALASGAPEPSPKIRTAAQAIARAEGFYVAGSIPARAHNPGNLKLGGATLGTTGITVFDSDGQGWAALYRQLQLIVDGRSRVYSLGMSIRAMGAKWTATAHEQLAWASNVAGVIGVSVDTTLRQVLA